MRIAFPGLFAGGSRWNHCHRAAVMNPVDQCPPIIGFVGNHLLDLNALQHQSNHFYAPNRSLGLVCQVKCQRYLRFV